ncbi:PREDICTED: Fanconi anemia-associated protein of 20 kDa [Acanthisitta chloris]|uniref:Fanconi anemia-associated protein of 20 kDa n=1 Tax=Acanthisitta chloris TaxID=57068 RepID=UPI0004F0CF48|nr:PREDICTED: Fanconi anemia-associated protein of 20 kDa [Acanthisitta chloris]
MGEDGGAKLRLKGRSAGNSPGNRTLTDRWPKFEKEGLNECEQTWVLLLEGISQDTDWDTVPSFPEFLEKESPRGSKPGPESCEKVENQSEGSSALESCPMCQVQFSGRLSQLDIDAHLAKCLSESAGDVMW